MASEQQLHQILAQIQNQAVASQRQLNIVKAQISSKEREKAIQGLTLGQIEADDPDMQLYRGVGKMFVSEDRDVVLSELRKQQKDAQSDVDNLNKKRKFLEQQVAESQGHLNDLFSGMDRAAAAQS